MPKIQTKLDFNLILAALCTGILYLLGAYSFASLIFKGPISHYLAYGFNLIIISNIVGCLFGSRFSSLPSLMSLLQTSNLAIFALISASLVTNLSTPFLDSGASDSFNPIYTIYMALILLCIFSGILLWLLGKFELGNLIRFVPYPVIVAFLAASGWILIAFSLELILGNAIHALPKSLLNPQIIIQLLAAVILVITIMVLQKRFDQPFIMPMTYVIALVLFYLIAYLFDIPLESFRLSNQSHMTSGGEFANPFQMLSFANVHWKAFLDRNVLGNSIAILIITPLFLLVTLNGIEKETQHEFNYNRELKYTGISNIVLPLLGGGTIVSAALSATLRNYQMCVTSRWVGVIVTLVLFSGLFFGTSLLQKAPLFIVASIPLMSGVGLIKSWLLDTRTKLSRLDYALLWFIFLIIVLDGFLIGIFLGVVASLLVFDYRYGQTSTVRNTLTGLDLQSNNERGMAAEAILKTYRPGIDIIILQGYLFFGNINTLIEKLILRMENKNHSKLYFIILDFRNTQGMDPSSAEGFFRLYKHAREHQVKIIFSHLSQDIFQNILSFLKFTEEDNLFLCFSDLDYSLEWCENYFLQQKTLNWKTYFAGQLALIFPQESELKTFSNYLEPIKVNEQALLFSEGDDLQDIYFLESGVLDLLYQNSNCHEIRMKTIYPGVFLGETSLYLGMKQIFSCRAKISSFLYRLSFDNLIRMERENPNLALIFHRYIVCQSLNRLTHTHKTILSLI